MSQFRNISRDARRVGYGCAVTTVKADGVLMVQDAADKHYADQKSIWEKVVVAKAPVVEKTEKEKS